MSHLHHIDGHSTAAAQYQAYLERMRVAQSKEEESEKVRRRNQGQKFQEHLDSEDDSEEASEEKQGQDESEQPAEEASQEDGFGSHYA